MDTKASVTPLKPGDAEVSPAPLPEADEATAAYWERLQALRAELADLRRTG